jgi:hypothetical protein
MYPIKKIFPLTAVCASLIACSFSIQGIPGFSATPTQPPPPAPTETIVFTETPTLTPILPTFTFTFTPTYIGADKLTPTGTPELVAETPSPTGTPAAPNPLTPTYQMDGFTAIQLSTNVIYEKGCAPEEVQFTAQVTSPANVAFVVLFVRFKSSVTGAVSEWTSITMENRGAGTFTHTLKAENMKGYGLYKNPTIQYQLVPTDLSRNILGRTQIFDGLLSLRVCNGTPTP